MIDYQLLYKMEIVNLLCWYIKTLYNNEKLPCRSHNSEDPTRYITNVMKKTDPIGHYMCTPQNKHGGHTFTYHLRLHLYKCIIAASSAISKTIKRCILTCNKAQSHVG